jgi:hypothetical protein
MTKPFQHEGRVDYNTKTSLPLPSQPVNSETPSHTQATEKKHTAEDFANAAFNFYKLVYNPIYSPDTVSQLYQEAHPDIDAEPLRYSERRQSQDAWRKFNRDSKSMFKLFACLDRPCRYIISAKDSNLPQEFESSTRFYDKAVNEAWKKAIEKLFKTKNRNNMIWFKLEVGENGKIHAHVFADHDAALNHLPRGTTPQHKVRLIETPESAVRYLLKPALSYSTEHLAIWVQARRDYPKPKQLPRVSGFRNLPNSRTWNKNRA